jgi:large subunit ribosomal protein L21
MYAILSHGGRQYRVSAGDRLIVDRLSAEVGSVIALEPVLLTGGDGDTAGIGKDVDGMRVAATVVAHRRGKKLRIFKYKAKKRYRRVAGYRSDLTELHIDSILARGAALPKPVAVQAPTRPIAELDDDLDTEAAAPDAVTTRPKRATRAKAAPAVAELAEAEEEPAADEASAPAAKPARRSRAAKKQAADDQMDPAPAARTATDTEPAGSDDEESGDGA